MLVCYRNDDKFYKTGELELLCLVVGGIISEVFCIYDDGSPEEIRGKCQ